MLKIWEKSFQVKETAVERPRERKKLGEVPGAHARDQGSIEGGKVRDRAEAS